MIIRIKPKTPATKRPSYMDGLDYIARNDEPDSKDRDQIVCYASVQLLAALFGIPADDVAFDLIRVRAFIEKEERGSAS